MLKNFLTITVRSFMRQWNYSLINTLGLSVGIAACLIIFLIVRFDKSFDTFHAKANGLYRVVVDHSSSSGLENQATVPYPFITAFRADFAHIPATLFHYQEEAQVAFGSEKIGVENILFADSLFPQLFSFTFLSGNPAVELGQPGKVFLTEALNKKINAAGNQKTIKLNNQLELEIAGIVADPPANSHIQFSLLVSYPSLTGEYLGLPIDQWGMTMSGYSYVELPQSVEPAAIETQFKDFVVKYYTEKQSKHTYKLQPLTAIHFNTEYASAPNGSAGQNKNTLVVLGFLGGFILLVACINFVNLSTAQAVKKSRETGVRKTLGATRGQLVGQFLGEAFLITLLSAAVAVVLVDFSVQPISAFLGKQLSFHFLSNPVLLLFLTAIVLVTGFFSGLYPAFVLSGFNPVTVLKNKLSNTQSSGAKARKFLVVFQFVIAQVLLIGTLVVASQMDFIRSKPLGFAKEAIVNVELPENDFAKIQSFRNQLQNIGGVERASFSLGAPTSENDFTTGFNLPEGYATERFDCHIKPVDFHYLDTYGLKLVAGRWFNENEEKGAEPDVPKDQRKYAYVVNETLAKKLGFANPEEIVGRHIVTGLNDLDAEVVGVVADFHTNSLHQSVEPSVLVHFPYFYYDAGVRLNTANLEHTLTAIKKAYASVYPDFLIDYKFLDDHLESLYRQEERTFSLIQLFAGLSIFISCLGLYGLISFLTQQKVKEVGVRKVFGASVAQIVMLFSRSFVGLILVAFAVAGPLAWYFMNQWLSGFAYHVSVGAGTLVLALFATLVVALATVSYRAVRAAVANPSQSLRSE